MKKTITPVKGFYSATELAAVAGCCSMTIIRDIKFGRLKARKSTGSGRGWLIAQGNAADYLETRKENRR